MWQPIETAPKDGTRILLATHTQFAAGHLAFRVEDEWKFLGYDEGVVFPPTGGAFDGHLTIGPNFLKKIPNPNAGKRHEWWALSGCSAFDEETAISDYDGPLYFEPTHWMPLPPPPPIELQARMEGK